VNDESICGERGKMLTRVCWMRGEFVSDEFRWWSLLASIVRIATFGIEKKPKNE
jgi:hypothetical protein